MCAFCSVNGTKEFDLKKVFCALSFTKKKNRKQNSTGCDMFIWSNRYVYAGGWFYFQFAYDFELWRQFLFSPSWKCCVEAGYIMHVWLCMFLPVPQCLKHFCAFFPVFFFTFSSSSSIYDGKSSDACQMMYQFRVELINGNRWKKLATKNLLEKMSWLIPHNVEHFKICKWIKYPLTIETGDGGLEYLLSEFIIRIEW